MKDLIPTDWFQMDPMKRSFFSWKRFLTSASKNRWQSIVITDQLTFCCIWMVFFFSERPYVRVVCKLLCFLWIFFSELGGSFPYLLASQYLISGLGAVLGLLTAAFATTLLREIPITSNAPLPIRSRSQLHPDQGRHLRLQSAWW